MVGMEPKLTVGMHGDESLDFRNFLTDEIPDWPGFRFTEICWTFVCFIAEVFWGSGLLKFSTDLKRSTKIKLLKINFYCIFKRTTPVVSEISVQINLNIWFSIFSNKICQISILPPYNQVYYRSIQPCFDSYATIEPWLMFRTLLLLTTVTGLL